MKKFFSISREQTPIIIILLVIILLGAGYFFIYIPNKDEELQQEHFRWLQRVDNNIAQKLEGCDTLLSHLLESYSDNTLREGTKTYIRSLSQDNFILFTSIDTLNKTSGNSANNNSQLVYSPNGQFVFSSEKSNQPSKDSIDHVGTLFSMHVYEPLQTFIISASKGDDSGRYRYTVSMQYTFVNFLTPLLPK